MFSGFWQSFLLNLKRTLCQIQENETDFRKEVLSMLRRTEVTNNSSEVMQEQISQTTLPGFIDNQSCQSMKRLLVIDSLHTFFMKNFMRLDFGYLKFFIKHVWSEK